MINHFTQTIAAISTARQTAALAVIRVSGDEAITICEKCIRFPSGKLLSLIPANTCKYCEIVKENGETIDTGLVTVFKAPHSATGEDTVEISCHGGLYVSSCVLERVYECGAVPALRGEFTRRSFANGKISLTQAENIGNILYAQSDEEIKIANRNIKGKMKEATEEIYSDIVKVVSSIYAEIDFPDEGLEELSSDEVRDSIDKVYSKLEKLEKSYKLGKAVVEGVKTCICGKPNVGKSTLLNLLCREDRAIVTDISGTTRDIITESVICGKSKLILSDTAGIHDSDDKIELIGIEKASNKIDESEFIILTLDSSKPLDKDDEYLIGKISEKKSSGIPVLVVINKTDIGNNDFEKELSGFNHVIKISAKDNSSYDKICSEIDDILTGDSVESENDAVITNARQHSNITRALSFVKDAKTGLKNGTSFAGISLENALASLGELDGRNVTIEVVNDIFSRFCVGK